MKYIKASQRASRFTDCVEFVSDTRRFLLACSNSISNSTDTTLHFAGVHVHCSVMVPQCIQLSKHRLKQWSKQSEAINQVFHTHFPSGATCSSVLPFTNVTISSATSTSGAFCSNICWPFKRVLVLLCSHATYFGGHLYINTASFFLLPTTLWSHRNLSHFTAHTPMHQW